MHSEKKSGCHYEQYVIDYWINISEYQENCHSWCSSTFNKESVERELINEDWHQKGQIRPHQLLPDRNRKWVNCGRSITTGVSNEHLKYDKKIRTTFTLTLLPPGGQGVGAESAHAITIITVLWLIWNLFGNILVWHVIVLKTWRFNGNRIWQAWFFIIEIF